MKFEPHPDGERMFAAILPGHPGFRCYKARAGYWNFVIGYDQLHGTWTATFQPTHVQRGQRVSAISCDPPPEGQLMKTYDSMHAAEAACRRRYKMLMERA